MKKLIIFLLMMLPLGVFAQESKIAIVKYAGSDPGYAGICNDAETNG